MTKIAICGDIHLNLRNPKLFDWERDRFIAVFKTLAASDADTVVLSGDIVDRPKVTLDEISTFYEGINLLNYAGKNVYVIAGNHEVLDKETTTFSHLPEKGYTYLHEPKLLTIEGVDLHLVGHNKIHEIENLQISKKKCSILISHYRSDIGVASEEVDNDYVSKTFSDTILSDIHYRLEPRYNIQYTSSPYGIHYTPKKAYGYITLTINKGDYFTDFVELHLPSKIKLSVNLEDFEDTLDLLDDNNYYNLDIKGEATNSMLNAIKEHTCIDKFSFQLTEVDEEIVNIADTILEESKNSIAEIIAFTLEDMGLTEKQLNKTNKLLLELL